MNPRRAPATRWRPRLDPRGPRYLAVVDAIAEGVASGKLLRGERMPPLRQLSAALGLNLATVSRGVAEASRRGLLRAQHGRGTFVAADPGTIAGEVIELTLNLPPEPEGLRLGQELARVTRALLEDGGGAALLRYPELGGARIDRAAGAQWLGRRGLAVQPGHVVVSNGADHGIHLALVTLAGRARRLLVEDLSYPGARTIAGMLGLPVAAIASDADGMRPDALERATAREGAIVFLTPTLHNPTGRTMPRARREELARVVERRRLWLVEDEVYGWFDAEQRPAFLDLLPERTVHVTSVSKCFAPGLRIGYVAARHDELVERLAAAAGATTCTPATATCAIATRWIMDGVADAILHAVREEMATRNQLCQRLLKLPLGGSGSAAPHRWLVLPDRWHRADFVERARQHGVAVRSSDAFAVDRQPPEAIRFSIAAPRDRAALERALLILARTLREPHAMRRAVG